MEYFGGGGVGSKNSRDASLVVFALYLQVLGVSREHLAASLSRLVPYPGRVYS
jgi:hypothetical protein